MRVQSISLLADYTLCLARQESVTLYSLSSVAVVATGTARYYDISFTTWPEVIRDPQFLAAAKLISKSNYSLYFDSDPPHSIRAKYRSDR